MLYQDFKKKDEIDNMVNDPNATSEVELTIESLHGIVWKSDEGVVPEGDLEPPNVTATVAFS